MGEEQQGQQVVQHVISVSIGGCLLSFFLGKVRWNSNSTRLFRLPVNVISLYFS